MYGRWCVRVGGTGGVWEVGWGTVGNTHGMCAGGMGSGPGTPTSANRWMGNVMITTASLHMDSGGPPAKVQLPVAARLTNARSV